jgi:hypothetical protein
MVSACPELPSVGTAGVCDGQDALALGGVGESLRRSFTGSRGRTASPGGLSELSWGLRH